VQSSRSACCPSISVGRASACPSTNCRSASREPDPVPSSMGGGQKPDEGELALQLIQTMVCGVATFNVTKSALDTIFTRKCHKCFGFQNLICPNCKGKGLLNYDRRKGQTKAFGDRMDELDSGDYLCPFCEGNGTIKCTGCKGAGKRYTIFPNGSEIFNKHGKHHWRLVHMSRVRQGLTGCVLVRRRWCRTLVLCRQLAAWVFADVSRDLSGAVPRRLAQP